MTRWLPLPLLFVGCTAFDLAPVERQIGTGAVLAHAVGLVWRAVDGEASPCVNEVRRCFEACERQVVIRYGPECPIPLVGVGSGVATVQVDGWSQGGSLDNAQLQLDFERLTVGGVRPWVRAVENADAYADRAPTDLGSTRAVTANVGWWFEFEGDTGRPPTGSLPGGVNDAWWTVFAPLENGAQWRVAMDGWMSTESGGSWMANGVTVSSDCDDNPVAGAMELQETWVLGSTHKELPFHAACDGAIDVGGRARALDFAPR